MRQEFGCPPSQLRRGARAGSHGTGGCLVIRLVHRSPYAAEPMLRFLAARAVPGVEDATTPGVYRRVLGTAHGPAVVALQSGAGHVTARLRLADLSDLGSVVAKLRRLLDADADPVAVDGVLAADPAMAALVAARPGLRVPGAVDGFELAVRAILGQQVSVAAAVTLAGRVVVACGQELADPEPGLERAFPTPAAVADADLEGLGLTGARARALRVLGAEAASGRLQIDPGADRAQVRARLLALPGIGTWTVEYIAMRALADPDAWPATDLVLRRQVAARNAQPQRWQPWRAYGAVHLWADLAAVCAPADAPADILTDSAADSPTKTPADIGGSTDGKRRSLAADLVVRPHESSPVAPTGARRTTQEESA